MGRVAEQLDLYGLDGALQRLVPEGATPHERRRIVERVHVTHDIMSELPTGDDLLFLHSGLCQCFLPHSRPLRNSAVWRRKNGRFTLIVNPGVLDTTTQCAPTRQPTEEEQESNIYVGVPYGATARIILIHLQTEGVRSRTVRLEKSCSAFLRSLGMTVSGGKRGTVTAVEEQAVRIAKANFSFQWRDLDTAGNERFKTLEMRVADEFELWRFGGRDWAGTMELSERFYNHLRDHAVPLDKRGIVHLSGNCFGLDLYALLAFRLPRLTRETHIRWASLQEQIGSDYEDTKAIARRVREVMPDVFTAYPHAKVEIARTGLILRPSKPAVPETKVNGFRLLKNE
jgi:Plasmid encoded RepA protein